MCYLVGDRRTMRRPEGVPALRWPIWHCPADRRGWSSSFRSAAVSPRPVADGTRGSERRRPPCRRPPCVRRRPESLHAPPPHGTLPPDIRRRRCSRVAPRHDDAPPTISPRVAAARRSSTTVRPPPHWISSDADRDDVAAAKSRCGCNHFGFMMTLWEEGWGGEVPRGRRCT